MGTKNYKNWLAMLASILQNVYVYVDLDELVGKAKEYLKQKRCKCGVTKKENTEGALKCWNLEQIIEAGPFGKPTPRSIGNG